MNIVQKLKAESLRLRKERNPIAASITFVLSEIEKVGKNSGNRETTEDEAIKVVQKLVATLRDNLKYKLTDADVANTNAQILVLESVLPKMATEAQLRQAITSLFDTVEFPRNKGSIMKAIRAEFGALADMKLVGTLFEEFKG